MTKKPASRSSAASPAGSAAPIDAGLVREIAQMLSDTDLTEIEVEKGDLRIRVAREIRVHAAAAPTVIAAAPVVAAAAPAAKAAPAQAEAAVRPVDHPGAVKSPMVGTAYRRPSPDAAPFIDIGTVVKAGDKLLLVEAMKTFNEIVATRGGIVTEIMVEDGQPVEYGQPLVIVE